MPAPLDDAQSARARRGGASAANYVKILKNKSLQKTARADDGASSALRRLPIGPNSALARAVLWPSAVNGLGETADEVERRRFERRSRV